LAGPFRPDIDRAILESHVSVPLRDLAGDSRTNGPIDVGDGIGHRSGLRLLDRIDEVGDEPIRQRREFHLPKAGMPKATFGTNQELAESSGNRVIDGFEQIGPTDDLPQRLRTQ
jgi:hypothetical protein